MLRPGRRDGGRIAFYSYRDGNAEIYAVNADGTGVVRLTDNEAADRFPAWSPDGGRIAFHSDRDGNYDIFVMNADGTGVVRLTDDEAYDVYPAWSPDGGRIAFMSERDGNYDIYVMNVAGSDVSALRPRKLTLSAGLDSSFGIVTLLWKDTGAGISPQVFVSERRIELARRVDGGEMGNDRNRQPGGRWENYPIRRRHDDG